MLLSSYLHCRWADLEELEKDKRIHQKVKRFKAKQQLNTFITEVRPKRCTTNQTFHCMEVTTHKGQTLAQRSASEWNVSRNVAGYKIVFFPQCFALYRH